MKRKDQTAYKTNKRWGSSRARCVSLPMSFFVLLREMVAKDDEL
jgi:hypothetical protein